MVAEQLEFADIADSGPLAVVVAESPEHVNWTRIFGSHDAWAPEPPQGWVGLSGSPDLQAP